MLITQVGWLDELAARDIHLIPGLVSPRLDQLLYVRYGEDRLRSDLPPTDNAWRVTFDALFHPAPPSHHGVRVNDRTGEVTVANPLPAGLRLRSFIITATVTQGATQLQTRIRVHVHNTVKSRWLTPAKLTVRQNARNMRFSVLARFDDGVIGDITNWGLLAMPQRRGDLTFVHRVNSPDPLHHWSQEPDPFGPMFVDVLTGEIGCQGPTASVKVNLHVGQGGPVASAMAEGAPPWSTPVRVTRVAGPGIAALSSLDIHNVLFLPDGFVDDPQGSDRAAFEAYVRELVNRLNYNSLTRPFDVLSSKFNYFSAWVPSAEAGCSALAEHFSFDPADPVNGHLRGEDMEIPVGPTGVPTELSLVELIDTVGPPTPVFDPPGSPAGDDATGRVHDWQRLYGPLPTATRTAAAYPEWLRRGTRVLINERNTAFHVCADFRPRVDRIPTGNSQLTLHPLRLTTGDFNTFLQALRDDQDNPLPPVWAEGGKDDALVVILCRTNRYGGNNNFRDHGRYLCVPLGVVHTHDYVAKSDGFDLVPDPVPVDAQGKIQVDPGAWAVVAHELAHPFTIDDEYGGIGTLPDAVLPDVRQASNTQERAALLDGSGRLVAKDIKWRWRRLRQAGVLLDPSPGVHAVRPDPSSNGQFLLSLTPGHAAAFADPEVDIVRLRKPKPRDKPQYSDRLRVLDVRGDQLTVKLVTGSRLDPNGFGAGDLVVAPVRGADPDLQNDRLGDDVELVHRLVIDRINATHNPLNAKADDPPNRTCSSPTGDERPWPPIPATNFDVKPTRPRLSYRIVGLYEGGHAVDCGVYHPTGQCIVNVTTYSPGGGTPLVTPFCAVCRYAMVDLIDPSAHGRIDADYDYDYPR